MSPKCVYTFRLYRAGPSVKDAIYAWRSGVLCFLGLDQGRGHDVNVDLSEELTEWTNVQQLFTVSSSYLHNTCFPPDGKATFLFRVNIIPRNVEEKVTIIREPCNHGAPRSTPSSSIGSIVEKEWEMYKKVQWNIPCKSLKDCQGTSGPNEVLSPIKMVYKSPVFEISDQEFHLSIEISGHSSTPHSIRLYRSGPSMDRTIRWWMQVRNGSDCDFAARHLDLSRDCVDWTYEERLISFEEMSESSFSVEFLMSKVDTICGVIQSPADDESPLELDPSNTEFLSFRVNGQDYTVHRSLLIMRVPVFEAMLSHDTVEGRTGVLRVDDCDQITIALFLHYVDTGNGPLFSDEKFPRLLIRFIAELFAVSHKYLVPELRDMCLSLLDEISLNDEYCPAVAVELDKYMDILSTFPKEMLQKWPMIEFCHTYMRL